MVKICDVVDGCEDCPKYGDDCDGKEMTREEAINVIKGARQYLTVGNPIWNVKKVDEAMNMAIEALSADAVQGEWEHWGSPFSDESEVIDTIVCSVCGARH